MRYATNGEDKVQLSDVGKLLFSSDLAGASAPHKAEGGRPR